MIFGAARLPRAPARFALPPPKLLLLANGREPLRQFRRAARR
ncbi:MAG: hypothetical protein U5N55_03500 [Cypionkella sp.]|nr:hypothetical protein [Cypionkella sp.]